MPEDVIYQALKEFDAKKRPQPAATSRFTNLGELLANSPLAGAGLDLERTRGYPRVVEIE